MRPRCEVMDRAGAVRPTARRPERDRYGRTSRSGCSVTLSCKVSERAVSFGHALNVLFLFHCFPCSFCGSHQFFCKLVFHTTALFGACSTQNPVTRQIETTLTAHGDWHLIVGATDTL